MELPPGATWGLAGVCLLFLHLYTYVFFTYLWFTMILTLLFCLLVDARRQGRPLAYLVGHDPRHMGVARDVPVP